MSRKARADLMPEIRGGIKRAFKAMADNGRPISTIWIEMFEQDPFNAMRLAIAAHPKEMQVDIEQTVTLDTTQMTPDVLQQVINERRLPIATQEPDSPVH